MRRTIGAALAAVLAAGAHAQQAQRLEKIEITGSQIKRTDLETVAPVDIITREEIERSGRATVAEVIRAIPANSGNSSDESFSNSFAPGGSAVSLRGLGSKATLVLLNGRRVTAYGFAHNVQETFVDLNSIPTSAVERIEILKDGASAIYGTDAIAGVVNVILRKEYRGVEVSGQAGRFNGRNDYRFAATAGVGDLGRDRFSAFATFDYYRRPELFLADTAFGGSRRDRRFQAGGRNHELALLGGGTWIRVSDNAHRAITDCPGRVLTGPEAVELGLISSVLGNTALNRPGNTFCAVDFSPQFSMLPETERFGLLGRASYALTPTSVAYVDLGLSRVRTFQTFQAPFFSGAVVFDPAPEGTRRFNFNVNFAPGAAGNPFDSVARYQGVLNDVGTRDIEIVSDTVRMVAGLNFAWRTWEFDSAVGWSRNEPEIERFNFTTRSDLAAVFNVPNARQPPIPLSAATDYNLDRFTLNSDAVRARMVRDFKDRVAATSVAFADTRVATELMQLPGGPLGLAAGAELRRETLRDRADDLVERGELLGNLSVARTDGTRNVFSVFGELGIPITREIEAQVAARYDRYSDYGSSRTPKVGVKFKPHPAFLLRANWGKGFRAPSLVEVSFSEFVSGASVFDPVTNQTVAITTILVGTRGLRPETSENATLGIVFEPSDRFSVGLNYYSIGWKDKILARTSQGVVDSGDEDRILRDPVTNAILVVFRGYENFAEIRTRGVDIDARYRLSSRWGRWTARANVAYVDSWKFEGVELAGTNGTRETPWPSIARTKASGALDLDWRAVAATLRYNFVRGIKQTFLGATWFMPQDPRFQNGVSPGRMRDHETWDLYASYAITKNFKVTASVTNMFDREPPYDPSFFANYLFDLFQFDSRGRQYRVGFSWKM